MTNTTGAAILAVLVVATGLLGAIAYNTMPQAADEPIPVSMQKCVKEASKKEFRRMLINHQVDADFNPTLVRIITACGVQSSQMHAITPYLRIEASDLE